MHAAMGRPRSAAADDAIRNATLELLAMGSDAVTFEGIAARAGVAKTTIYRRYRTRGELLFRMLLHDRLMEAPDTGSLRGDIRVLLGNFTAPFHSDAGRRGIFVIIDALERDEQFRASYVTDLMAAEERTAQIVVRAAVERGELERPVPPDRTRAIIIGPALIRCALYREMPDERLLGQLSDDAVAALRSAAANA